jgi:hypothetical protein
MTAQDTAKFASKHVDIFPKKATLQLKIREVRQKIMAEQNISGSTDTAGPSSVSDKKQET